MTDYTYRRPCGCTTTLRITPRLPPEVICGRRVVVANTGCLTCGAVYRVGSEMEVGVPEGELVEVRR